MPIEKLNSVEKDWVIGHAPLELEIENGNKRAFLSYFDLTHKSDLWPFWVGSASALV